MQIAYSAAAPAASSKAAAVFVAALLGALFVYAVGFMPAQAMHDAAHDTRHAITAPCH
jgi:cobalt transporter subunit CbtB